MEDAHLISSLAKVKCWTKSMNVILKQLDVYYTSQFACDMTSHTHWYPGDTGPAIRPPSSPAGTGPLRYWEPHMGMVAHFQTQPHNVKEFFKYLKATPTLGILYVNLFMKLLMPTSHTRLRACD